MEARGRSYVLAVMSSRGALSGAQSVLPPEWEWVQVSSGNRTSRAYRWAYGPLSHEASTGRVQWLLARRSVARPGEHDDEEVEAGKGWVERCMLDGMAEVLGPDAPVWVEISVYCNWGEKRKNVFALEWKLGTEHAAKVQLPLEERKDEGS